MQEPKQMRKRTVVRVTSPDTASGYVGHMTVEELKAVAAGDHFEVSCPACGLIHLNRGEIAEIEARSQNLPDNYLITKP